MYPLEPNNYLAMKYNKLCQRNHHFLLPIRFLSSGNEKSQLRWNHSYMYNMYHKLNYNIIHNYVSWFHQQKFIGNKQVLLTYRRSLENSSWRVYMNFDALENYSIRQKPRSYPKYENIEFFEANFFRASRNFNGLEYKGRSKLGQLRTFPFIISRNYYSKRWVPTLSKFNAQESNNISRDYFLGIELFFFSFLQKPILLR